MSSDRSDSDVAGAGLTEPVLVLLLLGASLWEVYRLTATRWRWHHTVGALLMLAAAALWIAARRQLGRSFTARVEARTLVTTGVYRRLRHPIYLAAFGMMLGVAVFVGSASLGWGVAAVGAVEWWRARRESRALEAAFGEEYRSWRRGTWM